MTDKAARQASALAAWQRAAAVSVGLAGLLLGATVLSSIATWLMATAWLRLSLAAMVVALAAWGWWWLTRRASALRQGLDDLVNQDRLSGQHGGQVDAFVTDRIKSGRRFAFHDLLRSRVALAAAALLCVALAILGPRQGDGANIEDPESVATDADWIVAKSQLMRGGASLEAGDPARARQHLARADAATDKLREAHRHDVALARAAVVVKARLALAICRGGDADAAVAPIGEALAIVRGMPSDGRRGSRGGDGGITALFAWLEQAQRLMAQGRCPEGRLQLR